MSRFLPALRYVEHHWVAWSFVGGGALVYTVEPYFASLYYPIQRHIIGIVTIGQIVKIQIKLHNHALAHVRDTNKPPSRLYFKGLKSAYPTVPGTRRPARPCATR